MRKNTVFLVLSACVLLLLVGLGAGGAYLSGIGKKSPYPTAQGNLKSTQVSSVEEKSKGGVKTSKSVGAEMKRGTKKSSSPTRATSSSEPTGKVIGSKQENQVRTTTAQESHVTRPVTYVATYKGFTGYSTVSYDEAFAIARSLSENQKDVTENTQEVTQQSTQQSTQESIQEELEKTIASIQAKDPNTQINIIK
ncbi:hypothetical protein AALM99_07445 [Lactococcus muris]|uniref:Uncharacterized protein n=1 Tax=Lactococcus muris TaxID=2941330 RepID=A0ABV4DBF6_9LACT